MPVYCSKIDFEGAKIYLGKAQEKLPLRNEWETWNQTLPEIVISNEKRKEIEIKLSEIEKSVSLQKNYVRQWASKLLTLQNSSGQLNLD